MTLYFPYLTGVPKSPYDCLPTTGAFSAIQIAKCQGYGASRTSDTDAGLPVVTVSVAFTP